MVTDTGGDALAGMIAADVATLLPDDYRVKVDRAGMAHGLELRPPLLDHELLKLAAHPVALESAPRRDEMDLKQAVRDRLPAEVLDRPRLRDTNGVLAARAVAGRVRRCRAGAGQPDRRVREPRRGRGAVARPPAWGRPARERPVGTSGAGAVVAAIPPGSIVSSRGMSAANAAAGKRPSFRLGSFCASIPTTEAICAPQRAVCGHAITTPRLSGCSH